MDQELITIFGISLGLGLLVGLQREHANAKIAGIRTFPIITLFGTLSGLLAKTFGGLVLAAALLALAGLVIFTSLLRKTEDPGKTTEAAILLMFAVGAFLTVGDKTISLAVAGITAVLLHFKDPLHGLVDRFGYTDIKVVMQFVLISLVILPVLPNQTYGPYDVLNPHDIWLMVVLIVGLSIVGYFAYKFFGNRAGTLLSGILGGLASSTATTVSFARHSKAAPQITQAATFVVLTASAIAFVRMIVEIGVVAPAYLLALAPPLAVVLVIMGILAALVYTRNDKKEEGQKEEALLQQENPAQLKSALVFGAIYGLVVLGTAAAKDYFGRQGLYAVALVSGLTDVDAITLSTAKLVTGKELEPQTGWRLILIASLANLVFKGGIVAVMGDKKLFRKVALLFAIALAGGLLVLFLWPDSLLID
ncbi:MAG: MgtC family [uncultured Cytophagales bacterium]|uniref:MgtC family n=2 Tax=uncultured Cytophagales bacterium TaxID=158755 RepID=A0A6J4HSR7_9SPHI|nr:MAG: MgtC family [uncultured Cytophagales bacterium]